MQSLSLSTWKPYQTTPILKKKGCTRCQQVPHCRNDIDIQDEKSIGVSVFFEKENIDTGKMTSEHILTLHATFAENESLGISQNGKKGNRSRMARGEYVSSNPPYGYRLVEKELEIYEPEAAIVRRIFAEYLGGDGLIHEQRMNAGVKKIKRSAPTAVNH